MRETHGAIRLIVWDGAGDWCRARQVDPVHTLEHFHRLTVQHLHEPSPVRIGYCGTVSPKHFATWCRLAWVWMRASHGTTVVVEELADVTTPGKAPPEWGEIVRKHRHYRGAVYALTQRPAESDKTIAGNATIIHGGRMNLESDEDYMARLLRVPREEIAALADLEFIERNMRTRALYHGKVTF